MSAVMREVAPVDDGVDLFEVKEWVLATFDLAVDQQPNCQDPLLRLVAERRGRAWLRLFAEHRGRAWLHHARPSVNAIDGRRRHQLERLVGLAPAAVAWVERHAGSSGHPPWGMFRRHLARRCDAIIGRHMVLVDEE